MKPQKSAGIRYTKAPAKAKVKRGGAVLVSRALIKPGSTNLIPKLHVKRGDLVILMTGSKKAGVKSTGKVLRCMPKSGKVVVEGINIQSHYVKPRGFNQNEKGEIKRIPGPVFASKVMLFCAACKKPTRSKIEIDTKGKKIRHCKHCNEAIDG